MNWCKAICALSIAIYGSSCLAQDITDVEAKPYGSYTGGAIDTVDLATGNLMLNIPLVSFPQLGSLPPLSFSVELNNAPYSQIAYDCDYLGVLNSNNQPVSPQDPTYVIDCEMVSSRYDTSPPGAEYQYSGMNPVEPQYNSVQNPIYDSNCENGNDSTPCGYEYTWGYEDNYLSLQNMGAYLTSSFDGGIIVGQNNSTTDVNGYSVAQAYQFSLIDPSGTTHELESDNSTPPVSWNTYRTSDGSGYSFIPSGSGNSFDPFNPAEYDGLGYFDLNQVWLENASDANTFKQSGLRLGTLYSPTGIKYTSTIQPYTPGAGQDSEHGTGLSYYTPQALITTEMDPSGNSITRGPWYWSGYYSVPIPPAWQGTPIADINTIYANNINPFLPGYHGPYYKDSVGRLIPDAVTMQATHYGWNQTSQFAASMSWPVPGIATPYIINYMMIGNIPTWTAQGNTMTPDPSTDIDVNGYAISSITLPNGTSWGFTYDSQSTANPPAGASSGDLIGVTTPAGGSISYTYISTPLPPLVVPAGQQLTGGDLYVYRCNGACHAVASRTESDGLSSSIPGIHSWTTHYTYGMYTQAQQQSLFPSCPMVPMPAGEPSVFYAFWTTETDPLGNDIVHSFCPVGVSNAIPIANQYHETMTKYYQGSAPSPTTGTGTGGIGTLLKTVTTSLQYQTDIPTPNGQGNAGNINMLPTQIATTTPSGSTTVSTTDSRQYSKIFTATKVGCGQGFNNATDAVNDWYSICEAYPGSPSSSPPRTIPIYYLSPTTEIAKDQNNNPVRTASTTFMFQNPPLGYASAHMDVLPLSQTVSGSSGGVGTVSGTTVYGYDEANGSPQGAYGNLTSKTETYYLSGSSSGGTSTTTHTVYNSQGMPTTKIDGNGNTTAITYDSTGLFPNKIQRPTTNGVPHIDNYSYDSNTGNLNSHTDENNQTTGYSYDVMGRATSIQYPDGGSSTFCYTDIGGSICSQGTAPFSLYTSTIASPDPPITTTHTYDGWGRQYRSSITSDPLGATIVGTTYDWDGRVTSVSNPYRSTPAPNDPPSGITSYIYDALGRKTIQTQPDNSTLQWCYDGILTTGQTNCSNMAAGSGGFTPASWTDISDETGRHTQQVFDALGHMGAVMEPDPASGSLALETDYTYDVFGNLLSVNQAGASGSTPVRIFAYDMPSRVTFACNPEALAAGQSCTSSSGNGTRYFYDPDSNLTSKVDNRAITTSYTYDALNRLLSKTYPGDTSGTASSCYLYDGATAQHLSGRLVAQWTQKGACLSSSTVQTKTAITAYDAMGRLQSEQRCMGANCSTGNYTMSYAYDLAGKLLNYPSGYGNLNFTNSYDTAGRLSTVTQGANQPLFSVPSYTPAGALSGVQLGTSISMSRTFDSRQRVTSEKDSIPAQ